MKRTRRQFLQNAGWGAAILEVRPGTVEAQGKTLPKAEEPLDSEKFRSAVLSGDGDKVTTLLQADPALLYSRDARGNSVYVLACLAGHAKIAEMLVDHGLVLDIFEAAVSGNVKRAGDLAKEHPGVVRLRALDGRTPLHFAAEAGKPEMVALLNALGADLSAGPESPALAAADFSDTNVAAQMCQTLLGNASDPNAKRKDGNSLLHLAASHGNADLVRLLICRGAKWNVKNTEGQTPRQVAKDEAARVLSNPTTVEQAYYGGRFLEDLNGNSVRRDDSNGLPQDFINQFVTVAHFNFDKVKQMLQLCPALLMTRATWDELAIEAAAHMGLVSMAQYLADLGSVVSACTAVILGSSNRVKASIRSDPQRVHERGAHNFPLLSFAAFGDERLDIAEFLLQLGTRLDASVPGQTPLHVAAAKGYIDLAKMFLDHGADVNVLSKSGPGGTTPLAVAVKSNQMKMADFLRQHGGRV